MPWFYYKSWYPEIRLNDDPIIYFFLYYYFIKNKQINWTKLQNLIKKQAPIFQTKYPIAKTADVACFENFNSFFMIKKICDNKKVIHSRKTDKTML